MQPDFYLVLGVAPAASSGEIHDAYRRLAKLYHPDVSGADTAAKFRAVQEAYETLGDVARRRDYDAQRGRPRGGPAGHPPPRPAAAAEPTRAGFAGWPNAAEAAEAGSDLHLELSLSAAESARSGQVALELPTLGRCPGCGGRGHRFLTLCRACWGRGYGLFPERFLLQVPPGLFDGQIVQVPLHAGDFLHRRLVIHVRVD
jgi:DnaJ-class molecular chaperone